MNLLSTLRANMGPLALVGLLAYVLYGEFFRPAPSRQDLEQATALVASAERKLVKAGHDLKQATDQVNQLQQSNSSLTQTVKQMQTDLKERNAQIRQKEQQLDAKAATLEDQYRAKVRQLQQAKKIAL